MIQHGKRTFRAAFFKTAMKGFLSCYFFAHVFAFARSQQGRAQFLQHNSHYVTEKNKIIFKGDFSK
jgi:hypothetical protein